MFFLVVSFISLATTLREQHVYAFSLFHSQKRLHSKFKSSTSCSKIVIIMYHLRQSITFKAVADSLEAQCKSACWCLEAECTVVTADPSEAAAERIVAVVVVGRWQSWSVAEAQQTYA